MPKPTKTSTSTSKLKPSWFNEAVNSAGKKFGTCALQLVSKFRNVLFCDAPEGINANASQVATFFRCENPLMLTNSVNSELSDNSSDQALHYIQIGVQSDSFRAYEARSF